MFGFIFTRHINSQETNEYWKECIRCIRRYYKNNIIMVIDDNSSSEYITNDNVDLRNCFIIQSEYPKRGEILAYYYFYKYKLFDKAVIIHDSVFLQEDISQEINDIVNVKFLWHFKNPHDDDFMKEMVFIGQLKNKDSVDNFNLSELTNLYFQREKWVGCFGVMSVITYDFLKILVEEYNIFNLLSLIKTRKDRCSLERIFSILCYVNNNYFTDNSISIFGEIVDYKFLGMPFYYEYSSYLLDKKSFDLSKISKIIKVWRGR
jgi:hypothetical protein